MGMKMIEKFPPISHADEDGLLAIGGDLEVGSLLLAYQKGIFPWPMEESEPLMWFAPPYRAILDFKNFKIPKRLKRDLNKMDFQFRVDQNFDQVVKECAKSKNRKGQDGTWIINKMIKAYIDMNEAGYGVSFETYNSQDKLVGGMYGVRIGNYFAGESMFYLESNASKFALINAVEYMKNTGATFLDIQMMTPLLEMFGAKEITRAHFMRRLKNALT